MFSSAQSFRAGPRCLADLSAATLGHEWLSFLLFWGMNIYIIYRGMDLLRKVENWAAPFVLVMTALLLGWAIVEGAGSGCLLNQPSKFHSLSEIPAHLSFFR